MARRAAMSDKGNALATLQQGGAQQRASLSLTPEVALGFADDVKKGADAANETLVTVDADHKPRA